MERGRASESFLVRGGAETAARCEGLESGSGNGKWCRGLRLGMVAKAGGVANPVHNGPHPFAPAIGNDGGAVGRPPPNLPDLPALLPALPAPAPAPVLAAAPSRPRPVRRPPPPLPPPNVARKEKQLVRTRSGCGVIESPLEQRITQNTQVLYHVTDAASARAIEESGVMLRGRSNCLFGSGIYFAKTVDIAARKARSAGAVVTAEVDLGRSYLPEAGDATLGFRKLQEMGFDSVHGRAAPLGPLSFHDEYVVYNADQVRVVSVSVPPEPKADEPESPCGILARCLMLAAVVWLAFDRDRGCVLSGCENGGECEGIVFRTCTCAGLHAGTRCAHHCNVSALLHSVPRPRLSSHSNAVCLLAVLGPWDADKPGGRAPRGSPCRPMLQRCLPLPRQLRRPVLRLQLRPQRHQRRRDLQLHQQLRRRGVWLQLWLARHQQRRCVRLQRQLRRHHVRPPLRKQCHFRRRHRVRVHRRVRWRVLPARWLRQPRQERRKRQLCVPWPLVRGAVPARKLAAAAPAAIPSMLHRVSGEFDAPPPPHTHTPRYTGVFTGRRQVGGG